MPHTLPFVRFHTRPLERWGISFILLSGLLLSGAIAWLAQQADQREKQHQFEQQAHAIATEFGNVMSVNMEVLAGLRGLYLASNDVNLDEFNLYTQQVSRAHPEIQALAWAPITRDPATFLQNMQQLGLQNYLPDEANLHKSLPGAEYIPISHLSPLIGNQHMLGLNLASSSAAISALKAARDSGLPRLTAPDFFGDTQNSFLLLTPVYHSNQVILNNKQRQQNLDGYVLASYRADDLFYLATAHLDTSSFHINITDITDDKQYNILNQLAQTQVINAEKKLLDYQMELNMAGRRWLVHISDTRTYPASKYAIALLTGGTLATFFVIAFLLRNSQWRHLAEVQVAERTAELKSLQEQSNLILNSSGEGILGLNMSGYTTFINATAQRMLGFTLEELQQQPQHDLIHHHHADGEIYPREDCSIYRAFKEGITTTTDKEVFWRKNGDSFPVEYTSTPICDEQNNIHGAVVIFRDITERKQNEQELLEARLHAEDASRAKSAFLATVSHEIRTPLNGMLGMAQLLANSSLNSDQKEFVDALLKSGHHLLAQMNDILDFSRIEADRLTLEEAEFNLHELCADLIRLQQASADKKQVKLTWNYPETCPHRFIGDSLRLRQILLNFLSNAIKFTRQGEVSLRITCQQHDTNINLQISVSDTGLGMDQATIAKLFNPFVQADASITRQYGGSGLGLAICERLARLMNADIEVTSTPGSGSTFSLRLQLPTSQANASHDTRFLTHNIAIDRSQLEAMAKLMGDMFAELIPAWLRETEKYLVQLPLCLQNHDYTTLHRMAHSLKSSSGNVGAINMAKLSAKLEQLAQKQNHDACIPLIEALQLQYPLAEKALLTYQKEQSIIQKTKEPE